MLAVMSTCSIRSQGITSGISTQVIHTTLNQSLLGSVLIAAVVKIHRYTEIHRMHLQSILSTLYLQNGFKISLSWSNILSVLAAGTLNMSVALLCNVTRRLACKKCGKPNFLTPHAFWNITGFSG